MQNTSALYNELIAKDNHWFEVALAIGESGRLITERNDVILFGNTAILVDTGGASTAFREDILMSLSTKHAVFNENYPTVGGAVSGEIDISMIKPTADIPKMARLVPFVRVTDGVQYSEWLQKGVYYVDTRETSHNSNGLDIVTIHGYDAMLKFEQNYPSDSAHNYPLLDTTIVQFLADSVRIPVDPRIFNAWVRVTHTRFLSGTVPAKCLVLSPQAMAVTSSSPTRGSCFSFAFATCRERRTTS